MTIISIKSSAPRPDVRRNTVRPDAPNRIGPRTAFRPHVTEPSAAPVLTLAPMGEHAGVNYAEIPGFRPLALDLHVPQGKGPFPLVVWIHGGAFLFGERWS
ncbi:hypothetical protein GCM10009853_030870 [Glycomyces scopariae]